MRIRRSASGLAGALLALTVLLLVLAVLLQAAGTDSGMMQTMLLRHAPAESTGLAEEDYPGVAKTICLYLGGQLEEFQYTVADAYGRAVPAFQPHEQQHMADCRGLFLLDRKVILGCMPAIGLLLASILWLKRRRTALRGFLLGCAGVLLLLTAVGIWAAVDFQGLFVLFHRLSFANDLWLLDPATDLLIRLMPIGFFIHYVTLIGATWLAALLLMSGGAALLLRPQKKDRKNGNEL